MFPIITLSVITDVSGVIADVFLSAVSLGYGPCRWSGFQGCGYSLQNVGQCRSVSADLQ